VHLFRARPALAVPHGVNTFAKFAQRCVSETEDAPNPGAKRVDNNLTRVALTQENNRHLRMGEVDAAGPSETSFIVVARVEQDDIHARGQHRARDSIGVHFTGGDLKIGPAAQSPAGEDGITVWHCAYGAINHNHGGGNGENTIDVKDSHDVEISDNDADLDREYNIVVHSVDAPDSTYNVRVDRNRCSRGGQGRELSAGIALLFVQKSGIENNVVDSAYGSAILIKDKQPNSGNWASQNRLKGNGVGQGLPAIVLQGTSTARLEANRYPSLPANASKIRLSTLVPEREKCSDISCACSEFTAVWTRPNSSCRTRS